MTLFALSKVAGERGRRMPEGPSGIRRPLSSTTFDNANNVIISQEICKSHVNVLVEVAARLSKETVVTETVLLSSACILV